MGKPIFGIKPIQNAILKMQDNPEQVCGSLHRELAKLCLKSKCYAHCITIIEQPVTCFKKSSNPMDIVNYLFYKAMILTGLKRFSEAIECFKSVISYPSQVTHKLHTESWKKLILLNMIEYGRFPTLPQYTAQMLKFKLENSFLTYKNLANAFTDKDAKLFDEIMNQNFLEFEKDKNLGLVRKLNKKFEKQAICDLSSTYLTMRFAELG